ncbi:SET domain-containing protein SmydA-8-like isoform X2 [Chelonus insularis]|uniref:SET domain-containing protein SmydA-8-like isoform X2 n=1 Tax=Chelonus insularis TaxID=460826 RepID=UPI00158F1523|nr:SET domain-containing protein SmydA-8-like isoform X2 [Chelonus insularis]
MKIIEIVANPNPTSKYKESYSEKYGKYLVAAKKLAAGEVIIREKPVAVGAASFNNTCLCFACLRVIPESPTAKFEVVCSGCNIAIFCSTNCENELYHSAEECQLFKEKLTLDDLKKFNIRSILLPLRLLLIRKQDEELWQKVLKLEAHLDARRNTLVWKERQENVVDVLKAFKLIDQSQTSDELIQQLCGILDVNSFELRSPGCLSNPGLCGIYIIAALMAHDCRGNTFLTVDDEFQLTIYASKPIEEGEPIFFNYTSSLVGTAARQAHLLQGKYFECDCKLCDDPEELGANLSSLLCSKCKQGIVRFEGRSKRNFYAPEKNWKCNMCGRLLSGCLIKTTLELTKFKIDELENGSIKELEILLKKLLLTFHSNHFLVLALKQKLLELYRHEVTNLNPKKQALMRIIELCKEVLQVLEIVEPGLSRLKGIMLYELHLPIMILADRNYVAREITLEEMTKRLEEAESYLKKSLSMILLEPATTPEGRLAKRALQDLKNLRQNLEDVRSLPSAIATNVYSKNDKKTKIKNRK